MYRKAIQDKARETIGTPWLHQGRSLRGIDCSGVIAWTAKQLGLSDYDYTQYRRKGQWHDFVCHFEDKDKMGCERISVYAAKPGDFVILKDSLYPCHCGVLAERDGRPTLIHAYAPQKKVIEEDYNEGYRVMALAAFKFPGVED